MELPACANSLDEGLKLRRGNYIIIFTYIGIYRGFINMNSERNGGNRKTYNTQVLGLKQIELH